MFIHFLGFFGCLISFVMWLPQARLVWANRNHPEKLEGVSITTMLLVLMNAATWGLYATLTKAFWAGAPGIVNFPLAVFVIYLTLKSKREAR